MEENQNTKSPTAEISEADRITEANEIAFLTRLAKKKKRLSYVTEDTLNDFKLQDVVMVVPGHGVSYPKVIFDGIPVIALPIELFLCYRILCRFDDNYYYFQTE